MAIIQCPKCSNSISEYAKLCPSCNYSLVLEENEPINEIKLNENQSGNKNSSSNYSIRYDEIMKYTPWYQKWWGVSLILGFSLFFIHNILTNKNEASNLKDSAKSECSGYGDESFIRQKMNQLNRDILEFNTIGKRKYYIRYISWSSGTANYGDQILDYSNSPCRD